jgi:hypothetical protein
MDLGADSADAVEGATVQDGGSMGERIERGALHSGLSAAAAVACVILFAAQPFVLAEGWCDLVFKDVLDDASSVIIAEYRQVGKSAPKITVQEVLKGACTDEELDLDPDELAVYRFKNGDQLLVALTSYHQPVRVVRGLGGCTPVSVLPIRGGKLRARDRVNYDFMSKSITLSALRADLLALLHPDS